MLNAVTPVIKAVDPQAQVWVGGMVMDTPVSGTSGDGSPQKFFEGILVAGAAPNFDAVAYHSYGIYWGQNVDPDNFDRLKWWGYGGNTLGKARFLRSVMNTYGINKPLYLNETSMLWCLNTTTCPSTDPTFLDTQADHIIRVVTRAVSEGVRGFSYYSLNGPGWRGGALLDAVQAPRPVFQTYQQAIKMIGTRPYLGTVNYAAGVEGYELGGTNRLHIVWTNSAATQVISVTKARFIAAYDRFGVPLTPTLNGSNYELTASYHPIYIEVKP
jgi:hypothetical protein